MSEESEFTGKVAIITGSSAGIGAAVAVLLASNGCKVTITGRNEKSLMEVAKKCQLKSDDNEVLVLPGDICDDQHVEKLVSLTMEKFGRIDILVNNAGIALNPLESQMKTGEIYDLIMLTNVRQSYMLSLACKPHLIETKGSIVNVSSVASKIAVPELIPYGMSKAAMDSMTRSLAAELGPKGVRVNSVNPGFTDTKLINPNNEGNMTRLAELCPLQKIGKPENVADMIVFLASNKASFITGSFHLVDGGLMVAPLQNVYG